MGKFINSQRVEQEYVDQRPEIHFFLTVYQIFFGKFGIPRVNYRYRSQQTEHFEFQNVVTNTNQIEKV